MAKKEIIVPESSQALYDQYHFSPAVRAGDLVYLSGIVASYEGEETDADMEAAMERAFARIDVVLKEAGADWSDIVDLTTYHTSIPDQMPTFMKVKDKWIPEPYPAWTAIDIDRLFPDRGFAEIKVVAYTPK